MKFEAYLYCMHSSKFNTETTTENVLLQMRLLSATTEFVKGL